MENNYTVEGLSHNKLSIVFSHNLNSNISDCGCGTFPKGGIDKVAGKLHQLSKKSKIIYVDTGDAFFSSPTVPRFLSRSLKFTARTISEFYDDLELRYFTPGDQDLAMGVDFLADISEKAKYKFLINNLNDHSIKIKQWDKITYGPNKIYITGVINPATISNASLKLKDPVSSLKEVLNEITKDGYNPKNQFHRLVLLSHSGLDYDKYLAKTFPELDWIIGAHTQRLIQFPTYIGSTRIVQVRSENYYLGEVSMSLKKGKKHDFYSTHEIVQGMENLMVPNPFIIKVNNYKKELRKIKKEEETFSM